MSLDEKENQQNEPSNMTLAIPKKTKIFIEQTVRERENSIPIHNIFQSELWRMRLEAAKVTVEILRTGDSTFSGDYQTPLKLLAQVDGLGPDFLLTVTLENISVAKIVTNLTILLHADPNHYKIENRYVELTPLMPGWSCFNEVSLKATLLIDFIFQDFHSSWISKWPFKLHPTTCCRPTWRWKTQ